MQRKLLLATVILALTAWSTAWAQNVQITKGPVEEQVMGDSAIIAWSTNVNSNTVVKYGTDPNKLDQTATVPWGGTTHRVTLQNLQPNTTYYYQVMSGEGQGTGTGALGSVKSFKTKEGGAASAGTQQYPPGQVVITNVKVENVAPDSAIVAFSTNMPASTEVKYGTDPNKLDQTATAPWGGTTHRVTLNNLQPNTTYYWKGVSTQAEGTGSGTESPIQSFKTKEGGSASTSSMPQGEQGTGQVVITAVKVENVTSNSAIVAFSTNMQASTEVKYGTDPNKLDQTAQAPWGGTTHRVTLNNLRPNTTYYWQARSAQAQGTGSWTESPVQSFKTKSQ